MKLQHAKLYSWRHLEYKSWAHFPTEEIDIFSSAKPKSVFIKSFGGLFLSKVALCSRGANMSKKIAEASSVDFHT